jgi:nicotinate-nucleotide pyrophosphorylase (carboxylating)
MQDIDIKSAVEIALSEDLNGQPVDHGDITANLIPVTQIITADIITREDCVLAGAAWVTETFTQLNKDIQLHWYVKDGDKLKVNQPIVRVSGNARHILTGERTALNFLQTLSGGYQYTIVRYPKNIARYAFSAKICGDLWWRD